MSVLERAPVVSDESDEVLGDEKLRSNIFVIRAHHLNLFRRLLHNKDSRSHAKDLRDAIESDRTTGEEKLLAYEGNIGFDDEDDDDRILWWTSRIKYATDTIGETVRSGADYESGVDAVYANFLNLPENAPVDIVEGQKDDLCRQCVVGQHCLDGFMWGLSDQSILEYDRHWLTIFLDDARRKGFKEPDIEEEVVSYPDMPEQQLVRRVKSTAGVVREVLASKL